MADLGGKPLIAWTIEAAQKSQSIDRVMVSTDDEEIAEIARSYGADVPFLRPDELARDGSAHIPVIQHALRWIEQHEDVLPDFVCLLQPTSPFRTFAHIDAAVTLLKTKNADAAVSVCEAETHPFLMRKINESGVLQPFMPIPEGYLRRQDFPPAYELNGAIYLCRTHILLDQGTLMPEETLAYVMDERSSLDIDTPEELDQAKRRLGE